MAAIESGAIINAERPPGNFADAEPAAGCITPSPNALPGCRPTRF